MLAIIEGPQWGWASVGTLACFAAAAVLLTAFALLELRTEGPLLDVRVFKIPRFTGGALSISVAFFCLFGFIFLITQYFQFVKGYSTLSAGVHTLPFAIVAAIVTPIAAVVALKVGTRLVVTTSGCCSWAAASSWPAFNSQADTAYFGPIIVAMVLLALGLSSITAPTTEAVMGSVADEQRGAAAGVNNTTRELGGTLGVAVFGSIFASSYRPQDHQRLPPTAHPGGSQGRGAPVHGRRAGRGGPRAPMRRSPPWSRSPSRRSTAACRWPASPGPAWLWSAPWWRARSCLGEAPPRWTRMWPWPRLSGLRGGSDAGAGLMPGSGSGSGIQPGTEPWRSLSEDQRGVPDAGDDRAGGALDRPRRGRASRSGRGAVSSTTRASRRASGAPRQKWGPKPKLDVGIGVSVDAQLTGVGAEDLLVTVGRGVEQQHRVPGVHGLPADGDRLGGRAQERDHRRGPAQQLLDGPGDERAVRPQRRPLVGCSERATRPPEIRLRVVSLPATSSWMRNMASSASLS